MLNFLKKKGNPNKVISDLILTQSELDLILSDQESESQKILQLEPISIFQKDILQLNFDIKKNEEETQQILQLNQDVNGKTLADALKIEKDQERMLYYEDRTQAYIEQEQERNLPQVQKRESELSSQTFFQDDLQEKEIQEPQLIFKDLPKSELVIKEKPKQYHGAKLPEIEVFENCENPFEKVKKTEPILGKRIFNESVTIQDPCYRCGKTDHWAKDCIIKEKRGSKCMKCGQEGHWIEECPQTSCKRCGKQGHWAKECPGEEDEVPKEVFSTGCHACGSNDHFAKDCAIKRTRRQNNDKNALLFFQDSTVEYKANVKCFKCQENGHFAGQCVNPQKVDGKGGKQQDKLNYLKFLQWNKNN